MNNIVLTGDRPTGQLHLGHYMGSLTQRLILQEQFPIHILIADTQVLNNDILKAQHVKKNILSLMKDYLAIGLKPEKVNFILQSNILELFELTSYLSNIVSLPSILRNPTIKNENKIYNSQINMGFLNYPIAQTADIILFDADLVPVGADQTPILELSNDIIEKFHHIFKTNIFKKIKPILSESSRVMGIDGQQKMSKSLNNAIFLSDNEKTLKQKINMMYTDSNHLKISDPGKIEGNTVFLFLDVFMKDKDTLHELKIHYQKGGLGDSYLKNLLFKEINDILAPIRDNYNKYSDSDLFNILEQGTLHAQHIAKINMDKIRNIIYK